VRALIEACSPYHPLGLRNRALIAVLYRSGLRIFEALNLYPKDIDLEHGANGHLMDHKKRRITMHARLTGLIVGATIMLCGPGAVAQDMLVAASDIGLTPEAVATSGLHAQLPATLQRLEDSQELRQVLASQRQQLIQAAQSVMALSQSLGLDPNNQQLQSQYQAAKAQLQSSQDQVATTRQALFDQVMTDVPEALVQKLVIWRDNIDRQAPSELRIRQRTDEQWQAIELAVIAERRAIRQGEVPDPQQTALLAEARADAEVVLAAANLNTTLPAVQLLFAQYAPPPAPS
jgi:hypothetical protein